MPRFKKVCLKYALSRTEASPRDTKSHYTSKTEAVNAWQVDTVELSADRERCFPQECVETANGNNPNNSDSI